MAGRPRKPILVSAREGDTRKRGANKHAAHIAAAIVSQRGIPEKPAFVLPPIPKDATPAIRLKLAAARLRVKCASEHWDYLAGELSREGMISTLDQGIVTHAAMSFAFGMEAFVVGDADVLERMAKLYNQLGDRAGLSESARAKFPKKQAMDDIEAELCG